MGIEKLMGFIIFTKKAPEHDYNQLLALVSSIVVLKIKANQNFLP